MNAVSRRPMPLSNRFLIAVLMVSVAGTLWSASASAQDTCDSVGCIDIVAIDGLVDEIQATNIMDTLRAANRAGNVDSLVFQIDSEGVVVSDARLIEIARAVRASAVPVSFWIGPSGAVAHGGAAELVTSAPQSGISPGSTYGKVGKRRLPKSEFGDPYTGDAVSALDSAVEAEDAVELGLVDRVAPIVREHVLNVDGVEIETTDVDGEERPSAVQLVRFHKLPLGTSLMHTVASPSVAYLLLTIALGLLLFEFYTAGIGVAGVVGAGSLVLASYGVAALPFNTWALVLMLLSTVAFAVDIQSAVPRVWTGIGLGAFTAGSLLLFTEFRPTWIALLVGVIGMSITMFSGMPAMVRARFGTPTIGRDWMVGEMGEAVSDVDPDGHVRIRGALWRARTNRATPISAGESIRVIEIDGPLVEVEPEVGGAKDYREMRNRGSSTAESEPQE